ncbi:hypothetical protein VA599_00355 [Chromobacterium sp. TRC.1.1.SA]|uniref:Uncharacterized protein n=1 Tax=Chromobacterium indicum TaxID=3110228 RepID=A0ABV0CDG5_9NEIS
MKRPRGNGLARQLADVLADAPRPMLLGELESSLDFQYAAAEIMSALVKMQRAGKVDATTIERNGPGRRLARGYTLTATSLGL